MTTLLLWLSACRLDARSEAPPPSCREVALRDAHGAVDVCDLRACETCVTSCGGACEVHRGRPPRYECPGTGWDVWDVCPDWLVPDGPSVVEPPQASCGKDAGERLVASGAGSGRVAVTHLDFATGCCPDSVAVDVAIVDGLIDVTYVLLHDVCDCACELDVSYVIEGVPSGEWTIVAGPSAATARVVAR